MGLLQESLVITIKLIVTTLRETQERVCKGIARRRDTKEKCKQKRARTEVKTTTMEEGKDKEDKINPSMRRTPTQRRR